VNGQSALPLSSQRLPYSAAAGGIWEGLAKELQQRERANGLPTDGFLGSFAYLPTSSDEDTAPSNPPSSLSGPADVPLSVATLNHNFLPNGLPRFTGGPPDYLSKPPTAAQSDPANVAPASQSILFQRPPSSFDLGASSPDTGDFGPDTRNLAEPGLPLSKSDAPYFPPPIQTPFAPTLSDLLHPPTLQGAAASMAQVVAPFSYKYFAYEPPPDFAANSVGKLPSAPDALGIGIDAALFLPQARVARAAEFGLGAAERAAAELYSELITGTFADLEGKLPPGWQRNHINQDGVFGGIVPHDEAFTVGMKGNILSEPGSPHYQFHRSLEDFWNQFRNGGDRQGQLPTIAEYHQAAEQALVVAGFTPGQASYLVKQAANDLTSRGVSLSAMVPKIPRAIWRTNNY
jgi:hypothetical protein